jgi:hypothetical protein
MQLVTNEPLARRRFRIGTYLYGAAMVVLMAALLANLYLPQEYETAKLLAPFLALPIFFVPYLLSRDYIQRYGPRNRQDAALAQAGKGLDQRFSLVSFPSGKLPDYLLIGPSGIYVLVPRGHTGTLVCRGDRWAREGVGAASQVVSTLWGTPLGNPTRDLVQGVGRVQQALADRLGDAATSVPVNGLVVFTHPQAKLRTEGCSVQATTAKNLKNQVRGGGKGGLSTQQLARIRDALVAETSR